MDNIALALNDHNGPDIPVTRSSYAELEQEPGFADIVIDSIPGLFYVLDSQGWFVRWNHLLEEITGLSADMLHGTDALRIIFADDRELVADKIREVFEKGMAEVEARLLGRDGLHDFWFTGRRQDIGPMAYLVGSGVDTTERKWQSRLSVLATSSIAVWYSFHRTQFSSTATIGSRSRTQQHFVCLARRPPINSWGSRRMT